MTLNVWLHNYFTISPSPKLCWSANNTVTQISVSSTLLFMANHLTPCPSLWMKSMSISDWKGNSNNLLARIQPHHNLSNVQTHRMVGSSLTWLLPMVHNGHITGMSDHTQWGSRQWARHLGIATGNHWNSKNGPPQRNVNLQTLHRRFVLILGYQLSNTIWSLRKAR